jgi:hypothetical protein
LIASAGTYLRGRELSATGWFFARRRSKVSWSPAAIVDGEAANRKPLGSAAMKRSGRLNREQQTAAA